MTLSNSLWFHISRFDMSRLLSVCSCRTWKINPYLRYTNRKIGNKFPRSLKISQQLEQICIAEIVSVEIFFEGTQTKQLVSRNISSFWFKISLEYWLVLIWVFEFRPRPNWGSWNSTSELLSISHLKWHPSQFYQPIVSRDCFSKQLLLNSTHI